MLVKMLKLKLVLISSGRRVKLANRLISKTDSFQMGLSVKEQNYQSKHFKHGSTTSKLKISILERFNLSLAMTKLMQVLLTWVMILHYYQSWCSISLNCHLTPTPALWPDKPTVCLYGVCLNVRQFDILK